MRLKNDKTVINKAKLFHRVVSGSIWSGIGGGLSSMLMLLAGFLVARQLGPSLFGEYSIIRSTINMSVLLAGLSLGSAVSKFVASFRENDLEKTSSIISSSRAVALFGGFVFAAMLIGFSDFFSEVVFNSQTMGTYIAISGAICFFTAINGSQSGALAGFEEFRILAIIRVLGALISLPVIYIGVLYFQVLGGVVGLLISAFFNFILHYLALKKVTLKHSVPTRYKVKFDELMFLLKFAVPITLSSLLVAPVIWICNAILVNIDSNGFTELGVYEAANQFKVAMLFIPSLLVQTILPVISNSSARSDKGGLRSLIKYQLIINIVTTSLIAIPVIFLAGSLMSLYGSDFAVGKNVLIILSLTAILSSVAYVTGQVIIGIGNAWHAVAINLFWAIIVISATYLFVHKGYGAIGVAYANLISYIALSFIQIVYVFLHKRGMIDSKISLTGIKD